MGDVSVLLVEDNCDDEMLAVWALKKIGMTRVVVAHDGLEAVNMLHGDAGSGVAPVCSPDLILLDLRLPKIDGLDVLRKIRNDERTREVKVLALTSSEDPHDKDVCTEQGVLAFFSKPLDEKKLAALKLF